MANTAGQILAYILCYAGLCGLLVSTCTTDWKTIARANGETTMYEESVGLWMKCSTDSGAQFKCTPFTSILHQSPEINISRALMITSIVLCSLASLITIPGLKCTKCLDGSEQLKSKTAMIGGGLSILGGLCAFGLITWYAYNVAAEFQTNSVLIRYEFGNALFIGGAAALLSIIGGTLMCISSNSWKQFRSHGDKQSMSQNQATAYV
ncbi:claudin-1 [Salminus brasiliensis]|uniref:claudin-1 n=1 Tax=Salminus brasiliensis TaxID=930266 RepID=UPI003B838985